MWLKIKPREPLLLGDIRPDAQFLPSQKYIPGRILRGAWAEWLLRQGASSETILQQVARLRIGNFFPAPEAPGFLYALPLPMSALECKREGGFATEPHPNRRGHGIVDILLPSLAYRLLEQQGARFPLPFNVRCRQCKDRMEPANGFYAVYEVYGTKYHTMFRPHFHAQTKVALSRHRRAATESMLYTPSALSSHTDDPMKTGASPLMFVGRVFLRDDKGEDAATSFREALSRMAIGAMHTRGYGRVEVEDVEGHLPPLGQRLKAFNETLRRLWMDIRSLAVNPGRMPDGPQGIYFSVDLLAPGIFRDDSGVPALVPILRLGNQTLRPILWMTRPDIASGWSTAWGLPKPTRLAARMGSVFVYRWEGAEDSLLSMLEGLEQEGIGERRDEGFGECLICHPFHLEVEEK
jgi:CRISPR-associated protein Csx10